MKPISMLAGSRRWRRIAVSAAATLAVTGGVVAMTAASASALPPGPSSCEVHNNAITMGEMSDDYASAWFSFWQEDLAAGNEAAAERDGNIFRNWDDTASRWFEIADINPC